MELCPICLTESAISHVSSILSENSDVNLRLRIYVSGGGCSGLQYGMALDTEVDPDDTIFDHEGVAIILSAYDQKYLLGSIVDFIDTVHSMLSIRWTQYVHHGPVGRHHMDCDVSYARPCGSH